MAKRFTDSGKWDDPFFLDMPTNFKLAYLYILDKVDTAGVWKVNKRMAEFCINERIDWNLFVSYMGDRLHIISDEKWWVTKFCEFQYGELSEDSKSKPIISVINLLKKQRLYKGYTKGIYTLKEKEKDKDKEKDKEKEEMVDRIYDLYPRKVSRVQALKAIAKALNVVEYDKLCEHVKKYAASVNGKDIQFIPHPSTWFNQERWNDVGYENKIVPPEHRPFPFQGGDE